MGTKIAYKSIAKNKSAVIAVMVLAVVLLAVVCLFIGSSHMTIGGCVDALLGNSSGAMPE